jgi:hypothetical protein
VKEGEVRGARRVIVAWVLALASVAAPTGVAAQGGSTDCGEVSYRVVGGKKSRPTTTFSAMAVVDLEIEVTLKVGAGGLPRTFKGEHELEVRVMAPSGSLYQVLTVPFTADAVGAGATRPVAGYPRPLKVEQASVKNSAAGRKLKVAARLPVGGTAISSSGLYGEWSIEVLVDGAEYECIEGRAFTITQ